MATLEATANSLEVTPSTGLQLELTRVIKAPRARVFDAWTRPEMVRMWFIGGGMEPSTVMTDPQAGGAYSIAMHSCEDANRVAEASGEYTKVNPYDLLQFTWKGSWVPGEESLVTIHFRDVSDGTELRLIHDRFNTVESRDAHNKGWNAILDRLAALPHEAFTA